MQTSSPVVVFFDIGDTLVNGTSWNVGARELLRGLKKAGLRVGVISNTRKLTREQLRKLLPSDFDFALFDPELVILSSEVGVAKPDVQIFLKALRKANAEPWDCLFVGENLDETLAAQSVRIRAARINSAKEDFPLLERLLTHTTQRTESTVEERGVW